MATPKRNSVTDGATTNPTHLGAPETIDPKLEELKATWKTVHVIEGVDDEGQPLKMYLRKPDFNVRKGALALIVAGEGSDDINARFLSGELMIAACYIGGDRLDQRDDTKLEACLEAAKLLEVNTSIALKKN